MSQFQLPPSSGPTQNPMAAPGRYTLAPNANLNFGSPSGSGTGAGSQKRMSLTEEIEALARNCAQMPQGSPGRQACQQQLAQLHEALALSKGTLPPTPKPDTTDKDLPPVQLRGETRDADLDEVDRLMEAIAAAPDPGTRRALELRVQQLVNKRYADRLEAERQVKLGKRRAYEADLEQKRVAGNEKMRAKRAAEAAETERLGDQFSDEGTPPAPAPAPAPVNVTPGKADQWYKPQPPEHWWEGPLNTLTGMLAESPQPPQTPQVTQSTSPGRAARQARLDRIRQLYQEGKISYIEYARAFQSGGFSDDGTTSDS